MIDFGDIPLKKAMIAWNDGPPDGDGQIKVVPHPDGDGWCDKLKLMNTAGACWCYWSKCSTSKRLNHLLIDVLEMIAHDHVDPIKAIEALSVIPEFREFVQLRTSERGI